MYSLIYVAAFAVGAVAMIGYATYNAVSQNTHRHQNFRDRDEPSTRPAKNVYNLTCPFCGSSRGLDCSYKSCGHACHRSCYNKASDNRCRFCASSASAGEDGPRTSSEELRRRKPVNTSPPNTSTDRQNTNKTQVRQGKRMSDAEILAQHIAFKKAQRLKLLASSTNTPLNGKNINGCKVDTATSTRDEPPSVKDFTKFYITSPKCSHCSEPVRQDELFALDCLHVVHIECNKTFEGFFCAQCEELKSTGNNSDADLER